MVRRVLSRSHSLGNQVKGLEDGLPGRYSQGKAITVGINNALLL